ILLAANPALTPRQLFYTLWESGRFFNPQEDFCHDPILPCGSGILTLDAAVNRAQTNPANGPTTVAISLSASPAIVGQPFTVTGIVSQALATGNVRFYYVDPVSGQYGDLCGDVALVAARAACSV